MQTSSPTKPNIILSDAVIQYWVSSLAKQPGASGVRLSVKKTGCSGLSYVVEYVETPNPDDWVIALSLKDTLYLDTSSSIYLNGLRIDYVKQGMGHQIVFENPNQTGQCGCGESFTVS